MLRTGYVQTPGWSKGQLYPPNVDSEVRVQVPEGYSLMVSFVDSIVDHPAVLGCIMDWVQISYTANGSTHAMARSCGRKRPSAFLVNAEELAVHFVSDYDDSKDGFKLQFSFHSRSSVPQQFADGTWNCSVPHWPDFRYHFQCDLQPDCRGGEDEAECPYTSDICPQGLISAGGGCFRYVIRDRKLSWHEASAECQRRGERLASLHNKEQWTTIMGVLALRDFDEGRKGVYVGIRTVSPARPPM